MMFKLITSFQSLQLDGIISYDMEKVEIATFASIPLICSKFFFVVIRIIIHWTNDIRIFGPMYDFIKQFKQTLYLKLF